MARSFRTSLLVAAALAVAPFGGSAQALPAGPGKDKVETVCSGCHALNMITQSSGYTEDQWRELIGNMIDLRASPDLQKEITGYLAAHYPPNQRRVGKPVPGPIDVTFKEWVVPTLGQRARDPIQAADGTIWCAGQFGNLI